MTKQGDQETWRCPKCGYHNAGNICTQCGWTVPEQPALADEDDFQLQHKRDMDACMRWRAEDPTGRALTLPDRGNLLDYLWAELQAAEAKAMRLETALWEYTDMERDYPEHFMFMRQIPSLKWQEPKPSFTKQNLRDLAKGQNYTLRQIPLGAHAVCHLCDKRCTEIVKVALMQFCSDCVLEAGGKVNRVTTTVETLTSTTPKAADA